MNETVNHRLALAGAFINQYDNLVNTEIGARYAFEMTTRLNANERNALHAAKDALDKAELNKLTFSKTLKDITGLEIDELRVANNKLVTVVNRLSEVQAEMYRLSLLSQALQDALASLPESEERDKTKQELDARIAELPQVQAHHDALVKVAESFAASIGYRDVSSITVAPTTLLVPKR